MTRELALIGLLLAIQLTLGVLNVLLGKHPTLVVAHLTTGTLLFALSVITALRFAPALKSSPVPGPAQAERAAAAA
jgi:heme A synthase